MLLGAGRARVDSRIDPAVGVILHKKVGDSVAAGEPLCTILSNDQGTSFEFALSMILDAYTIHAGPAAVPDLIVGRV
jgi:thymidine phosphorylase